MWFLINVLNGDLSLWCGIFAWWAFLAIAYIFTSRCINYPKKINTFTFFLPLAFTIYGIFIPFSIGGNQSYSLIPITTTQQLMMSLVLMYCFLPVGIISANKIFHKISHKPSSFVVSRELSDERKTNMYLAICIVICIVSLIQIYVHGIQFHFWEYVTFKLDYKAYAAHRYAFANATNGFEYTLFNKLPYGILPVAIIIIFNNPKFSGWTKTLFFTLFCFTLFQTGHKLPLISVVATCFVSELSIKKNLRYPRKLVFFFVAIFTFILVVVVPVFYLMQGEQEYSSAFYWSFRRIFLEPGRLLQYYFEVYPAYHEFLHGMSLKTVAWITGHLAEYIPPSVYIPKVIMGLENTSNPVIFIGEAWADFSYVGVIAASIFVGFLLQIYNIWFYRVQKRSLDETAFFLAVSIAAYHILESNVMTALFTYGLISNWIIFLLIRKSGVRS